MRVRSLTLLLLALCVGPYAVAAADASPRPSDTNNQPAKPPTPAPAPTLVTTPPKTPGQPPATPAPAPSTPAPSSSAPPPSSAPPANTTTPAPSSAAPSTEPTSAPTTTPLSSSPPSSSSNTSSSDSSSSGMGAGAIVGIVLACVGLVAIIAFFAYRHFRARREDAKNYDMEYGGPSPVLESSRAYDDKMYAAIDLPKPSRQTTATATPTDDIVVMAKYATPSSPKFVNSNNAPHLSPRPYDDDEDDVADFTKSVNNFDQSRGPGAVTTTSTEFAHSYRDGSYAESYAGGGQSYGGNSYGGGSFMNSFDHGTLGRETFRDTLTDEQSTPSAAPAAKKPAAATNGLAGLDVANNDTHWMEAMDEMRDTNDSYAMLEAGGSFNSRGSAMRFSNESDLRG